MTITIHNNYQVFSIKTRPQDFSAVIGQEPVVKAIIHALDQNKLHHAYLLTGTRGVGKTTIARIMAKAMNCLQGISSKPCNTCQNCLSITKGGFADLIEIDAASKTKVEDTRALLDTVIYAPTQGRYKIYLIDEVHMLSTHSFNALLKTLEEPPAHVKFILATTDPQKIPATILSRCLQFTLKWVETTVLINHLSAILKQENIIFELTGLELLAIAAKGSVRDALSLLEQSLAVGAGEIKLAAVQSMLGCIDSRDIIVLLNNVLQHNKKAVVDQINDMALSGANFSQILDQLINTLHQVIVYQQVEIITDINSTLNNQIKDLASHISAEDLQIFYQFAINAKRDLPYSPQPKLAFEMALIRMMVFRPIDTKNLSTAPVIPIEEQSSNKSNSSQGLHKKPVVPPKECRPAEETRPSRIDPGSTRSALAAEEAHNNRKSQTACVTSPATQKTPPTKESTSTSPVSTSSVIDINKSSWIKWVDRLSLKAIDLQIVKYCEFVSFEQEERNGQVDLKLALRIDPRYNSLLNKQRLQDLENKVKVGLDSHLSNIGKFTLEIIKNDTNHDVTSGLTETPASLESAQREQKQQQLLENMQNDPNVKDIINTFNASLSMDSVELKE